MDRIAEDDTQEQGTDTQEEFESHIAKLVSDMFPKSNEVPEYEMVEDEPKEHLSVDTLDTLEIREDDMDPDDYVCNIGKLSQYGLNDNLIPHAIPRALIKRSRARKKQAKREAIKMMKMRACDCDDENCDEQIQPKSGPAIPLARQEGGFLAQYEGIVSSQKAEKVDRSYSVNTIEQLSLIHISEPTRPY